MSFPAFAERAASADAALKAYMSRTSCDCEDCLADLLCDLMHWADKARVHFPEAHKPPRRIPVSETGYFSHFASMEEVKAAKSPQDFAREEPLALLRSRRRSGDHANELPLF